MNAMCKCKNYLILPSLLGTCPQYQAVSNGVLAITGNAINSTATTVCRANFVLVGDGTATCQSSGAWSVPTGACQGKGQRFLHCATRHLLLIRIVSMDVVLCNFNSQIGTLWVVSYHNIPYSVTNLGPADKVWSSGIRL